jgi:hypothetical protein
VLGIPIPNSIYFPARNDAERQIIARVVSQMKSSGQLLPGAPDIVAMWSGGAGMLEIKRAASKDLFGRRQPAGRASPEQKEMEKRAADDRGQLRLCPFVGRGPRQAARVGCPMTDAELILAARMDERKIRLDCVRVAITAKERGDRTDLLTLSGQISDFVDRLVQPETDAEGQGGIDAPVSTHDR